MNNYIVETNVACAVDVECAIMLQNICFWIQKNAANEKNYFDGRYWTYNSIKAFTALFPFWTEKQIRRILNNLESEGYLLTGNYNSQPYDRTKWYTLSEKAFALMGKYNCPNGKMKEREQENTIAQMGEPIPDIYTDIYTDKEPDNINTCSSTMNGTGETEKSEGEREEHPKEKEVTLPERRFEEFWETYPKKKGKGAARKVYLKLHPAAELHQRIIDAVETQKRSEQWRRSGGQYIPFPATWLNQSRWEDDPEDEPAVCSSSGIKYQF